MDLIPAIDLLGGTAVRLVQGDYTRRAASIDDPMAVVRGWTQAGVRWLHLVDLDGARDGRPMNLELAARIADVGRAAAPHGGVRVELGGGLRSMSHLEAAFEAGIDVAILGTAAIDDRAMLAQAIERWPGMIGAAVDVRGGRLALDGWTREVAEDPVAAASGLLAAGVTHLVVTDTVRDGTRRGPNLALLRRMRAALPGCRLVAAGGIGTAEQLAALAAAGLDGAVVGLALVDGSLDVEAALETVAREAV